MDSGASSSRFLENLPQRKPGNITPSFTDSDLDERSNYVRVGELKPATVGRVCQSSNLSSSSSCFVERILSSNRFPVDIVKELAEQEPLHSKSEPERESVSESAHG